MLAPMSFPYTVPLLLFSDPLPVPLPVPPPALPPVPPIRAICPAKFPPGVHSISRYLDVISDWGEEVDLEALKDTVCGSCA